MWQPTATLQQLQLRATTLAKIREFFAQRQILEVETPLMSHATVPDPAIHSFSTHYLTLPEHQTGQAMYLQTSPEFAMKRLLVAGSGAIYQICKAFRNCEVGNKHNPEFTILEWYRPDFDHLQLMAEMDELLQYVLQTKPAHYLTYAAAFQHYCDIEPHQASVNQLQSCAARCNIVIENTRDLTRDNWLDILMTHLIEPNLGQNNTPTFIYDYPASQAALARIRQDVPAVAERFEVYIRGVELANGFHELSDAKKQRQRFLSNLVERQSLHYPSVPLDENFLQALAAGLPPCAGVALGIDRLLMLAAGTDHINDVVAFPFARA